jgi:hypothetical protein
MDVLIVLVFVSIVLLVGALMFLGKGMHQGDYEHGDRLSLLPLEDDRGVEDEEAEGRRGA